MLSKQYDSEHSLFLAITYKHTQKDVKRDLPACMSSLRLSLATMKRMKPAVKL